MPKRETLAQFVNNFGNFSGLLKRALIQDWNRYTVDAHGISLGKVPILSGELQSSGDFRKAKITSKGIESSIVYTRPYAQLIHDIDEDPDRNLRPAGVKYGKWTKERTGEAKFLSKAITTAYPKAERDIFESVTKVWNKI